jgi:plastocyanin domain-containing protein
MKNLPTLISIVLVAILIGAALVFSGGGEKAPASRENVTVVDGVQYVDITARGGFEPRASIAAAGLPTILRFNTTNTFDCSASVIIPSQNISKNLPYNGKTEIEVGIQAAGTLQGSCGMGMYPFEVEFE